MAKPPVDLNVTFFFRNKTFGSAQQGLIAFAESIGKDFEKTGFAVLSREMKDFLDTVAKALFDRHSTPWPVPPPFSPGKSPPKQLYSRTGGLKQSIVDSIKISGTTFNNLTGEIGGKWPIHVHEFGATIKAKGKLLTIPLPAALDSRGVPLKPSAGMWKNTFVARSRRGTLFIFQRRGALIVPLYILASTVKIPPRLRMKETIDLGISYFMNRVVDQVVKEIIKA